MTASIHERGSTWHVKLDSRRLGTQMPILSSPIRRRSRSARHMSAMASCIKVAYNTCGLPRNQPMVLEPRGVPGSAAYFSEPAATHVQSLYLVGIHVRCGLHRGRRVRDTRHPQTHVCRIACCYRLAAKRRYHQVGATPPLRAPGRTHLTESRLPKPDRFTLRRHRYGGARSGRAAKEGC
jgi:hypothetical protein